MKIYWRALLLVCMILFALPVLATEESPADNACYEGGSMAGKCNWPTEAETEWAWTCGWYIARAERSVITPDAVPSWCGYHPATGVPGCYDSSLVGYADIRIVGAFMTVDNALFYSTSDNGSCQGATTRATIVEAVNSTDATDRCQAISVGLNSSTALTSWGYNAPANLYVCRAYS